MSKYVFSAEAKTDLAEIWEYIAQDNLDAADRWIARLREAFDTLARVPGIGHKREDLTDFPVLFWPVGAYIVIYRTQRDRVEVVAVTQGSRDIPSFLHRRTLYGHAAPLSELFSSQRKLIPHSGSMRLALPLGNRTYATAGPEPGSARAHGADSEGSWSPERFVRPCAAFPLVDERLCVPFPEAPCTAGRSD